ncbi:NFX1-type zinc finger-containing protein 1-like [Thrips palmi]|uniref:NFX1-type zinc finger-containing protein 1-like n=1 Tax=Thrips palmi TaxID=161013 RepID=A0A6P9A7W6_THRPL|nr:NFX1-type zinc finger-containing protein 1-like [Thrips palmi]XP_034252408.1 NFX1-type zinc finger-containing protein 1-like [Thrips palmi]XP_034252410.1 NFX1-type zinc finger-containing protein 1-like [Thrips palmi]XP_034252411.1 NFX1-type zinc finger-containing protein 1-like [Thrips palmi]XP_034252412.1 NFX1-type zinc finger-containing protein 1-like [Thrips palmi]XP_034252413.1 NFX1-type zinc finger-containing protein 1-like [Thrips palmi]XP_034252414.1 NFX1-type zinc finger-containing
MAVHTSPLFPTAADLSGDRPRVALRAIEMRGPYPSEGDLVRTHIDLLCEDFLRALRDQLDEIRAQRRHAVAYTVRGTRVVLKKESRRQAGIEMSFDASRYENVRWEDGQRFLTGNLVLLTTDLEALSHFIVGVVLESKPLMLREGRVQLKLVRGVNKHGEFKLLDQGSFVGRTFSLIESDQFYFPYLHVTNALRGDLKKLSQAGFVQEMVRAQLPSRPPKYYTYLKEKKLMAVGRSGALLKQLAAELNPSQVVALKHVLRNKVALVQGPPGTGKTYLGCKIAQYLVALKNERAGLLKGPILVVTTTNHAVHEFLTRCTSFTDKIIHGYSNMHERTVYGVLQERYDAALSLPVRRSLMKLADILAMTTTRAAFMRSALDKLDIKIVIVEEACEAPEGYVLASIPRTTEHVIQIGDHKQLRPSCACQPLADSHHLDLSLFERLVRNGADCPMLNEQRRMRPEVCDLVRPIYPTLADHPGTLQRPCVRGVDLRVPVFFHSTSAPEQQDGKGYSRRSEAEMVAELGNYFVSTGYDPSCITILTTYRKQMSCILQRIRSFGDEARRIRVTTVDNFQGEESDIVILSLVRSNRDGNVGFLKLENRACVALSRARDGLFMFGNLDCLAASGAPIWGHVRRVLTEAGRVGDALPLVCLHGKKTAARCGADVRLAAAGCSECRLRAPMGAAGADSLGTRWAEFHERRHADGPDAEEDTTVDSAEGSPPAEGVAQPVVTPADKGSADAPAAPQLNLLSALRGLGRGRRVVPCGLDLVGERRVDDVGHSPRTADGRQPGPSEASLLRVAGRGRFTGLGSCSLDACKSSAPLWLSDAPGAGQPLLPLGRGRGRKLRA